MYEAHIHMVSISQKSITQQQSLIWKEEETF